MGTAMSKRSTLLLIAILAVSSLIMVESAFAQSIMKPSVPEFTLKYVDNSYDVPSSTTTTTDPYTGKQTVTTHPGYHVQNGTIEVTIKNQQFTPYSIDNQHTINLFYNVSYKGHYEGDWKYYPPSGYYSRDSTTPPDILQSTSDYTVVPFGAPPEGEMDFRVQAQIGYYDESQSLVPVPGAPFRFYTFIGEVSGWSSTQTITIPEGQTTTSSSSPSPTATATPSPTLTPSQEPDLTPEDIAPIISAAIVIAVISAGVSLIVYFKKRKR